MRSAKKVVAVETATQIRLTYDSITQAGKATGVPKNNISAVCGGKRHEAGGYTWKYAENEFNDNYIKFYTLPDYYSQVVKFSETLPIKNFASIYPRIIYIPNLLILKRLRNTNVVPLSMKILKQHLGLDFATVKKIVDFWIDLGVIQMVSNYSTFNDKKTCRTYSLTDQVTQNNNWLMEPLKVKRSKMLIRMVNYLNSLKDEQQPTEPRVEMTIEQHIQELRENPSCDEDQDYERYIALKKLENAKVGEQTGIVEEEDVEEEEEEVDYKSDEFNTAVAELSKPKEVAPVNVELNDLDTEFEKTWQKYVELKKDQTDFKEFDLFACMNMNYQVYTSNQNMLHEFWENKQAVAV